MDSNFVKLLFAAAVLIFLGYLGYNSISGIYKNKNNAFQAKHVMDDGEVMDGRMMQ